MGLFQGAVQAFPEGCHSRPPSASLCSAAALPGMGAPACDARPMPLPLWNPCPPALFLLMLTVGKAPSTAWRLSTSVSDPYTGTQGHQCVTRIGTPPSHSLPAAWYSKRNSCASSPGEWNPGRWDSSLPGSKV